MTRVIIPVVRNYVKIIFTLSGHFSTLRDLFEGRAFGCNRCLKTEPSTINQFNG